MDYQDKEKTKKLLSGMLREFDLTKEVSERIRRGISAKNTSVVATAMLLKQHFSSMSKLMYHTTLLLMSGGCCALDIDHLNMQGITMSLFWASRYKPKWQKNLGKVLSKLCQ